MKKGKILIIILILLVVCGCGSKTEKEVIKNKKDKKDKIDKTETVVNFDAEKAYKDVIESYQDYLYNYGETGDILLGTPGFHTIVNLSEVCNPSTYDSIDCNYFEEIRTYLSYTYFDIDNDSIEELIVAEHGSYYDYDQDNPSNQINAIYYYEDGVKVLYLSPSNPGWGPLVDILEDGYLKYSRGHQDSQAFSFVKKEDSWDNLKTVKSYELEGVYGDSQTKYNITEVSNGKETIHKNVGWEQWEELVNKTSYDYIKKFEVDLNKLDWIQFIEIGD